MYEAVGQEHELNIGDRIQISQDSMPIATLVGRLGTVMEVFRVPQVIYLACVDGDPDARREWFFYHHELLINNAEKGTELMGDKSPKDTRKKTVQKQAKTDAATQKKLDAEAAKQNVNVKK